MIDSDMRMAIYTMSEHGIAIKRISRTLGIGRNTIKKVISQKGQYERKVRHDRKAIDIELLNELYARCEGWKQRIHEELNEQGIEIAYSTLTQVFRDHEIGAKLNNRCGRVEDVPGQEFQHDTSPYKKQIGEQKINIIASIIYFRYSKMRYLKFYRSFDRFAMKCFFHEALSHFGYSADTCIIDNTNLAVQSGTGPNAVIAPEMESFAKRYGFEFMAHHLGHANRKAGEERSFWFVETNFFPGRKFDSMEDLNQQAHKWSTEWIINRPVGKSRLIPAKAFDYEKPQLNMLLPDLPAPYQQHQRQIDQYGYVAFLANYYWVPGTTRVEVTVLQYAGHICIIYLRKELIHYPLPHDGVKNERFYPKNHPPTSRQPRNLKTVSHQEETYLRKLSPEIGKYLDYACRLVGRHHIFVKALYRLSCNIESKLFISTIERALKYGVTDLKTIEKIAVLKMTDGLYQMPSVKNEEYMDRESYQEGRFSDPPNIRTYNKYLKEEEDDQRPKRED